MAEQTITLQPGESKTVSFEVTPTVAKTYSVSVDGLTGSFRAIGVPVGVVLHYSRPKSSGKTHWSGYWLEDGQWHEIRDLATGFPPLLDVPYIFKPSKNVFLMQFRETYGYFSNAYYHGPYVFNIAGPGDYTFDAQDERLNGTKVTCLPKSNNLCRVKGRVIDARGEYFWLDGEYFGPEAPEGGAGLEGSDEEVEAFMQNLYLVRSVFFTVTVADSISGYVNAGQYFVGTEVTTETNENIVGLIGKDITADLKMVSYPYEHGEGYLWRWAISNIRIATAYPPAAFNFSGSIWRVEDVVAPAGYLLASPWSVHARVQSLSGLPSFSVAVLLIDSNGWMSAKPYRNYVSNTEIRETAAFPTQISGGISYVGWPPSWKAEVWAHPDLGESFGLSPDYRLAPISGATTIYEQAIQRGWIRVAW